MPGQTHDLIRPESDFVKAQREAERRSQTVEDRIEAAHAGLVSGISHNLFKTIRGIEARVTKAKEAAMAKGK